MPIESKRTLPLLVLGVLREHTDADHRLSQREIATLLAREHRATPDRKTLKAALAALIDAGCPVRYSGPERMGRQGEVEILATDWYLEPEFTNTELRLVIDALLFSLQIPAGQRGRLIDKITGLASRHFKSRLKQVVALPPRKTPGEDLLDCVELLNEAIAGRRRVRFKYGHLGADKQRHPKLDGSGRELSYTVNPYGLVAASGHYYLVCNREGKDDLGHYRVDRMIDPEILDDKARPLKHIEGHEDGGLNLPKHVIEHPYMWIGDSVLARFRVPLKAISSVYDSFGLDVAVSNVTETTADVSLRINQNAMRYWALQFSDIAEILEPATLRAQLREAGQRLIDTYR
jgi:predicted DNA-binding transcriptional regulator YafY